MLPIRTPRCRKATQAAQTAVAVLVGATNRLDAASSAPTDEPLPTDSIAR